MSQMDRTGPVTDVPKHNRLKVLLLSGLLVGTLDITAACIQTLVNGGDPLKMLRFVASGLLGKEALAGGTLISFYGLVFHYCIAMIWTCLFFFLYPRLKLERFNTILVGILYGAFVWTIMTRVILPLSAAPALKFKLLPAVIAMSILIVAIGLPLSFIARKYYRN